MEGTPIIPVGSFERGFRTEGGNALILLMGFPGPSCVVEVNNIEKMFNEKNIPIFWFTIPQCLLHGLLCPFYSFIGAGVWVLCSCMPVLVGVVSSLELVPGTVLQTLPLSYLSSSSG